VKEYMERLRAAGKSRNISRKGAKAAKFGQVRIYIFSLRSWRLGAIEFPSLRPLCLRRILVSEQRRKTSEARF
jgi:hypothetical protein